MASNAGRKPKPVNERIFMESIMKFLRDEIDIKDAAKMCGLSVNTYIKRTDQYLRPDIFGELPDNFFIPLTAKTLPRLEDE